MGIIRLEEEGEKTPEDINVDKQIERIVIHARQLAVLEGNTVASHIKPLADSIEDRCYTVMAEKAME